MHSLLPSGSLNRLSRSYCDGENAVVSDESCGQDDSSWLKATLEIELVVHLRDGDALITRARADLVALFLDDPAATHLLFVDADIGFEPDQVFSLLEADKDVAGMLEQLEPAVASLVVTRNSASRSMDPQELGRLAAGVFGPDRVVAEDPVQQREVMTADEASLLHQIGRPDRLGPEAQV